MSISNQNPSSWLIPTPFSLNGIPHAMSTLFHNILAAISSLKDKFINFRRNNTSSIAPRVVTPIPPPSRETIVSKAGDDFSLAYFYDTEVSNSNDNSNESNSICNANYDYNSDDDAVDAAYLTNDHSYDDYDNDEEYLSKLVNRSKLKISYLEDILSGLDNTPISKLDQSWYRKQ